MTTTPRTTDPQATGPQTTDQQSTDLQTTEPQATDRPVTARPGDRGSDRAASRPHAWVEAAVATGVLMLAYLTLRPYGDADGGATMEAARAFASPWWIVAHLAGALALAAYARLALRLGDAHADRASILARRTGLAGVVLVLPYYGAETFALHVIGREAVAGHAAVLDLVEPIRNHPVAMTTFALGLALLAASAVLLAIAWHRTGRRPAWVMWPLTSLIVLFLPQFFLPPPGRIAYGVLYAVSAAVLVRLGTRRR